MRRLPAEDRLSWRFMSALFPLGLSSVGGTVAQAALVFGGALVGLAVARAWTRRQQEALRQDEERAHARRVRQLERDRIEAVAELGRVAAELAERSLADRGKAPRRPAVGPRLAPLAGVPPVCEPSPFMTLAPPPDAPALHAAAPDAAPRPIVPDYLPLESVSAESPPAWSSPLVPLPRETRRPATD